MDIAIKSYNISENTLIWAIVASILLHVLLAVVLPNFKFDAIKAAPQVLKIELQKPKQPEPVAIPEPPKPIEPPKPEPIKDVIKPKITPKPITKSIEIPSPTHQEAVTPPPVTDKVIAVESKVDSTPHIVVPTPVDPPKPPEPSPADVDNALGEYGSQLGRAIAKHKSYPKIAQMRGWQGDVILDLRLDGSGNVLSAKVREGSGHEALDNQALEMVRKASPFPAPPEALRSRTFNISVPVSFKLENAN